MILLKMGLNTSPIPHKKDEHKNIQFMSEEMLKERDDQDTKTDLLLTVTLCSPVPG